MLLFIFILLVGFFLLAKGADALVEGAATIATKLGMDRWVVGLTIVAWGTSLPEVLISTMAAQDGQPGAALGNVLGSNVANAGLVLGVVGLILPRALVGRLSLRESLPLLASLGVLWFALSDNVLTRYEAIGMLVLFLIYTFELIFLRGRGKQSPVADIEEEELHKPYPWLRVLIGSAAIAGGAYLVLEGANGLAKIFGLSDGVVGLVILALGTSLPELAAGIASARKGHTEIGLGNIVGSNVFNTLAVVGIAGTVSPFGASVPVPEKWPLAISEALSRDLPVNLGFALFLVLAPSIFRGRAARPRAAALLISWLVYMAVVAL